MKIAILACGSVLLLAALGCGVGSRPARAANPLFATAGCYFPNGTRSASFVNEPLFSQYIRVGDHVDIVVVNGNCAQYSCTGGQCVQQGDLSMKVTQINRMSNSPFVKFMLSGTK